MMETMEPNSSLSTHPATHLPRGFNMGHSESASEAAQGAMHAALQLAAILPIPWLVLTLVCIVFIQCYHRDLPANLREGTYPVLLAILANHAAALLFTNGIFLYDPRHRCNEYVIFLFYCCMVSLEWLIADKVVRFLSTLYFPYPTERSVRIAAVPIYIIPGSLVLLVEYLPWPTAEHTTSQDVNRCHMKPDLYAYFILCATTMALSAMLSPLFSFVMACRLSHEDTRGTSTCAIFMRLYVAFSVKDLTSCCFVVMSSGLIYVIPQSDWFTASYIILCLINSLQGILVFVQLKTCLGFFYRRCKSQLSEETG